MNHSKLLSLLSVLLAAALLAGCSPLTEPRSTTAAGTEATTSAFVTAVAPAQNTLFGIGLHRGEGVLNPITDAAALNECYYRLVFDGLFRVAPDFTAENVLCESYEVSGASLLIKLRQDATFHDGSALTAADVVYSLELARNGAGSLYSARLACVTDTEQTSPYSLTVTFSSPRGSAAALLDVPVIKAGTGITQDAVGSGRYCPLDSGEQKYLVPYSGYTCAVYDEVALANVLINEIDDADVLIYGVASGNVDILRFDRLNSAGIQVRADADVYLSLLPELVFIGFNCASDCFAEPSARAAATLCADRPALCEAALNGRAEPTWGLFPDSLFPADRTEPDMNAVKSLFRGAGLKYAGGVLCYPSGEPVTVRLLVNSSDSAEAALAAQYAASLGLSGVTVEITPKSRADYLKSLKKGDFDMYVGSFRTAADFDFSGLLAWDGAQNYFKLGAGTLGRLLTAFVSAGVGSGELIAGQVNGALAEECPLIPVGYKRSEVLINRAYAVSNVTVTAFDACYNIYEWKLN